MSLSKDDLQASKGLIDPSEKGLIQRMDRLDDTLCEQMAQWLEETHTKIEQLTRIVTAEVKRTDLQENHIKRLRKHLRAV